MKWVVDYAIKRADGTIDEDLSFNISGKDLAEAYANAAREIERIHNNASSFIWGICLQADEDLKF